MKTTIDSHDMPTSGDDRLMDALLREHARAGSHADEVFLTRLTASLDDGSAVLKASLIDKHPSQQLAWPLGLAAALALAAGLLWQSPLVREKQLGQAGEAVSENKIPLHSELPPLLIEGTPVPIRLSNYIPVPEKTPEFYVPVGTALLSHGKPVTSSDDNPIIGDLDLITDGEKDAGEGYFVELLDGLQWVQIDLGKSASIQAIWLWHFHSQRRAYHDVIIRISDDSQFETGVATIYNNDYDNSAGMGKGDDLPYVDTHYGMIADGKGNKGRYVRLYSKGNTANELNHYTEVEVYGISR